MKITFLGTNGWYTNETGNTACILVESKTHYIVFDAGNGIYKLDKYIKSNKPIFLFISHFHLDHVNGLHTLVKFDFPQGIDIFIAAGRKKDLLTLVSPPYTIGTNFSKANINNLRTKIRIHELKEGKHNIGIPLELIKLYHAYTNHGFKIVLDEKTVAYTGDTGNGKNLIKLVTNADVLISECSYFKMPKNAKWGHLDSTTIAKLAKQYKVKKLLLTHFDPFIYTDFNKRKKAQEKARKIFPNTIYAIDSLQLII